MAYQFLKNFSLIKVTKDTFTVLFKPGKYFVNLDMEIGYIEIFFKTFIYGVLCILLNFPKSVYVSSSSFISIFFGDDLLIITSSITAIISTFIIMLLGALIILIISALCKGISGFKQSANISTSLLILSPLVLLASYLFFIHIYLYIFTRLIIESYGVWLLYKALTCALNGRKKPVKYILIFISIIILTLAVIDFNSAFKSDIKKFDQNFKEAPYIQMFKKHGRQ